MKKNIVAKLRLDIILLCIRAVTIVIWISIILLSVEMSLLLQIIFMAIIFLSDALDGIISRKYCLPLQQYNFRIMDAAVDKIGILLFLVTLFALKRISCITLFIIIGYNLLLILFPVVYIFVKSTKNVNWIQATMLSRFYAISVGLFCFLSIVYNTELKYEKIWGWYFLILGMFSLTSHILKIKKIKGAI